MASPLSKLAEKRIVETFEERGLDAAQFLLEEADRHQAQADKCRAAARVLGQISSHVNKLEKEMNLTSSYSSKALHDYIMTTLNG